MRLLGTTTSPYVRKVRIVAAAAGLDLPLIDSREGEGKALLERVAPLGKVPVLVLDDAEGRVLADSSLAVSFLWSEHEVQLRRAGFDLSPGWPSQARQLEVEGALDAAINRFYLLKDGHEDRGYVAKQGARVLAVMASLDRWLEWPERSTLWSLSAGCALDWMAFRQVVPLEQWPLVMAFLGAWRASGIGRGTEPR